MKKENFSEKELEKYSSALTLSDMEIFIFPDLMYALVWANIMSPIIWKWRDDPWFSKMDQKSFTYRINRVKQYIMEHYIFNLDLDTWGLTTKEKELERFKDFIDTDTLAQSNALFGYEGDKYYFDIDIRRHFGLDKYAGNIIPYWKTETVEAMTAFQYKQDYSTGAGECVSFSALYIAAMFIVARIPLDKMYLIATPLHSQNFIDEQDGFMTNNRRIVTKTMWNNGTELTEKARRAVENEKITIVSHPSGYIHTMYKEATIEPSVYTEFEKNFLNFAELPARLPDAKEKQFIPTPYLNLSLDSERDEIIEKIKESAPSQDLSQLALYAYRAMDCISWIPFIYAALYRNPVSLEKFKNRSLSGMLECICRMQDVSIYDGVRLAQPDEACNYCHADGIEKAILLLQWAFHEKLATQEYFIKVEDGNVQFQMDTEIIYTSTTTKPLKKTIQVSPLGEIKEDEI